MLSDLIWCSHVLVSRPWDAFHAGACPIGGHVTTPAQVLGLCMVHGSSMLSGLIWCSYALISRTWDASHPALGLGGFRV